jgi:di/tricarboxylate transporter
MTFEIALTLGIIATAVILFATEKLRVDVIALLVLLTLIITGLMTPQDAFSGFANPAVITVWAVFIVSGGLFKTGLADVLGERILRLAGHSEPRLIFFIMLICGTMSAFMNNIGATAILLPAVVGAARKANIPLSRLLIPLSFSSLMGGNMTLIGTPPNLLASALLVESGRPAFSFFDFTPIGVIVFGTGILYMVFIGRHLIPVRSSAAEKQTSRIKEYISEVRILPGSKLAEKTLAQTGLGAEYDLTVVAVLREEGRRLPTPDLMLRENDLLLVEGGIDNILKASDQLGISLEAEIKPELAVLENDRENIVEATIAPRSSIVGRSLRDIYFRDRYGISALAIWRQGEVITQRLRDEKLRFGDTLLLQGPRSRLEALQEGYDFLVLEPVKAARRKRNRIPLALGIVGIVLALVTIGGFHVSTAMVIGGVLMVLTGILNMDEAYQSIEWRSIFLIAGMIPLGLAMESTGTALFLANGIVSIMQPYGPLALLAGVYILASLLTEPISNAAATVLIVPIAIDIATTMGANAQPFVLAAVVGASTSFLTPVGHQANVLIFGPGGYRFADFARVGGLLNILLLIVTLIFLPMLWPLF